MENSTDHKPAAGARCYCGAQEVYFEGYALDPGDLGPVVGYGCDAQGHPYPNILDRRGFHIKPEPVIRALSDDDYDAMDDATFKRAMDWTRDNRPGWG